MFEDTRLEVWGISQSIFSHMVHFGEITEAEFTNVISKFTSVYDWERSKPRRTEQPLPELSEGQ